MLRWLLPREEDFFGLFERHAALTVEGAKEMQRLVQGGQNIRALAARIKEIEHETDVITHACVERLHKTFITPIDRDDIHRLITRMDDVMDYVESAAVDVMLYELTEMTGRPASWPTSWCARPSPSPSAVAGLQNVKQSQAILEPASRSTASRTRPTRSSAARVAALFREAKDPLLVIKWKEIYEALETATDRCEDVANIIEGVVLEHA